MSKGYLSGENSTFSRQVAVAKSSIQTYWKKSLIENLSTLELAG